MEDKFLNLTNTVYKLLEFFPESDPLKNRAKDKALSVMEQLMEAAPQDGASLALLGRDIDVLLGYLWIAKSQGWLNTVNCLIIENEYEKIKQEIKPIAVVAERAEEMKIEEPKIQEIINKPTEFSEPTGLSERQKKIIDYLGKNEKAQVMDLQKVLPNITKRTIRRDLDELLELGKINRFGEYNQVFYTAKPEIFDRTNVISG